MPSTHMTIEEIIFAAAYRADMITSTITGDPALADFITPEFAVYFLNMECSALWDALVSTYEDYCLRHVTIDVTANQENYPLPEDFYKFRKVFPILSGKRGNPLKKFKLDTLGEADSLAALFTSPLEESEYKINGNRLWLHPLPSTAGQLEMWYVPQYDPIINLDDQIDFRFPFGWEEYIIEGLAAAFMEKEESDASPFRNRQREILQRILVMAEDRDVGEPFQMINTEL